MTNVTLSDGTRSVNLYHTSPIETEPNIKKKAWIISGCQFPVVQYFKRTNRTFIIKGEMSITEDSDTTIKLLQYWMETGIGLETGTLTYSDDNNPGGISVFIPEKGVSYTETEGQQYTKSFTYMLKLIEV